MSCRSERVEAEGSLSARTSIIKSVIVDSTGVRVLPVETTASAKPRGFFGIGKKKERNSHNITINYQSGNKDKSQQVDKSTEKTDNSVTQTDKSTVKAPVAVKIKDSFKDESKIKNDSVSKEKLSATENAGLFATPGSQLGLAAIIIVALLAVAKFGLKLF